MTAPEIRAGLPVIPFANAEEWHDWLEANHATLPGAWVKFAKKSAGIASITYEEARDGALRYGWIDGLKNSYDGSSYLIRFTPRKKGSGWSKVNTGVVEALARQGLMRPAGLREMEAAKQDGRWDAAYDSQSTSTVPDDFKQALAKSPAAEEFFASLKSANRYAFLYRIQIARKPEVRASRIARFVEMLEHGEAFHPF